MSQAACTNLIAVDELETSYSMYCRSLRILIRQGKTLEQVQRSICWKRLSVLHDYQPRQYKGPEQLYIQIQREIYS